MPLQRTALHLATVVAIGLWPVTASASSPALPVIELGAEIGPIARGVFGINHRYAFDGFGLWDADRAQPAAAPLEAFREAGFTSLRFPGGTIANTYHFKRAIGPLDQRRPNVDGRNGAPLSNGFGPDEFGRFIEAAGAGGSSSSTSAAGTRTRRPTSSST